MGRNLDDAIGCVVVNELTAQAGAIKVSCYGRLFNLTVLVKTSLQNKHSLRAYTGQSGIEGMQL